MFDHERELIEDFEKAVKTKDTFLLNLTIKKIEMLKSDWVRVLKDTVRIVRSVWNDLTIMGECKLCKTYKELKGFQAIQGNNVCLDCLNKVENNIHKVKLPLSLYKNKDGVLDMVQFNKPIIAICRADFRDDMKGTVYDSRFFVVMFDTLEDLHCYMVDCASTADECGACGVVDAYDNGHKINWKEFDAYIDMCSDNRVEMLATDKEQSI